MKKFVAAAVAALAFAVVVSIAVAADPPLKVKAAHKHYVITGTAPDAAGGTVVAINISHKGTIVASDSKYTLPTSDNGWAFRVVVKKSELPKGRYKLVLVDEISGSSPKYITFALKIR